MLIEIPVSVAELFDKISILELKVENICDAAKSEAVNKELGLLLRLLEERQISYFLQSPDYEALKRVNKVVWDVCEIRRQCERSKTFGENFVLNSRKEYRANDGRAKIKQKINMIFNSEIDEVKSYENLSCESDL
ncbi:MAG: DUF6165 family protein [Rhodospirillales bacterium]